MKHLTPPHNPGKNRGIHAPSPSQTKTTIDGVVEAYAVSKNPRKISQSPWKSPKSGEYGRKIYTDEHEQLVND